MANLFFILLLASLAGLAVGLISPVALSKLAKRQLSRGTILKLFGGAFIASFIGFGIFVPDVPKPVQQTLTATVENTTTTSEVAGTSSTADVADASGDAIVIPSSPTRIAPSSDALATDIQASEANPSTASTTASAVSTNATDSESTSAYLVVKVVDGDTFDLDIDGKTERIRMIGVDTPETVDPRKVVQCFGKEASDKMKQLIQGKRLTIETDASQGERDKYGRLLAYAFLDDGTNVGLALIEQGYAHEYTYSKPYKYQASFKAAQAKASAGKVGLWADTACAGDTTKPAATTNQATSGQGTVTPSVPSQASGDVVKKSNSGICHAPGSTYYARTTNFTPFDTIEECLESGGRLPAR